MAENREARVSVESPGGFRSAAGDECGLPGSLVSIHHELTTEFLSGLKAWFAGYVRTFRTGERETQQNIGMKEGHTGRVCREILALGRKLGLGDDALRLAETIALLHDIGRFEQYAKYKTFSDRKSENHAGLGIRVLERQGILTALDEKTGKLILCAIRHHNRPVLEGVENGECLFYSRLLRDADKLDIWRVLTGYYHRKSGRRNAALELGFPDAPGFSPEVAGDLLNRRIVDIRHVRNLNDYKLLQAAWVFDVNFRITLDRVRRRCYLEKIRAALPPGREIDEIFAGMERFCIQASGGNRHRRPH